MLVVSKLKFITNLIYTNSKITEIIVKVIFS